jgi:hypothetical protein
VLKACHLGPPSRPFHTAVPVGLGQSGPPTARIYKPPPRHDETVISCLLDAGIDAINIFRPEAVTRRIQAHQESRAATEKETKTSTQHIPTVMELLDRDVPRQKWTKVIALRPQDFTDVIRLDHQKVAVNVFST